MPNYSPGQDTGRIFAHPSYADAPQSSGPLIRTYNGLVRPNTGYQDYDETADDILAFSNKILSNTDILLTEENASMSSEPYTLVVRDASGGIEVDSITVQELNLPNGLINGGTF